MTRTLTLAALAGTMAITVGCATDPGAQPVAPVTQSPSTYEATQYGYVRNIQVVERAGNASGAGAVLGAVLGAAVGSQVGSGSGQTAATIGGAIAGGYAGHKIEESRVNKNATSVYRVDVQLDNGTAQTFDFREVGTLRVGDRVRWENGQLYKL